MKIGSTYTNREGKIVKVLDLEVGLNLKGQMEAWGILIVDGKTWDGVITLEMLVGLTLISEA